MSNSDSPFAPVLRSERLTLRLFDVNSAAQLDKHLDMLNDRAAVEAMGDFGIRTREQYKRLLDTTLLSPSLCRGVKVTRALLYNIHLGQDANQDPTNGEILGIVSLGHRSASLPPDLGWLTVPTHAGRGYASEAAKTLLRYVREDLGIRDVVAYPKPSNTASVRVAEKVGFVEGGWIRAEDDREMHVVYIVPGMKRFDGAQKFTMYGDEV